MLKTQEELLNVLDEINIAYKNHEHPAVYTVEEADKHHEGIDGAHSKNLFFKDRQVISLPNTSDINDKAWIS